MYVKIFHRKVCRRLVCEPKCPGYLNKEIQLNSSAQKQAFPKQQERLLSQKKKKKILSNTT